MKLTANDYIEKLQLAAHPEGGYYRETYRSEGKIPVEAIKGRYEHDRIFSTAIYYLLPKGEVSRFHRMISDEIFHFYAGDPLIVHTINSSGEHREQLVGTDVTANQRPQGYVSGGEWFGAEVAPGGTFSLVGCTVAPGFEFDDFEIGERIKLLKLFPEHSEIIKRLTPQN